MAEIQPFRAIYYGNEWVRKLPRLICPPYDVISAEAQKRLLQRHPQNFVRVELPPGSSSERYERAAGVWRQWNHRGVLEREVVPCFYLYETTFISQKTGHSLIRRGFFGDLKLVPWGQGVFPQ